MNENQDYQQDLASIRELMERSVKFLSLSGLSGILAGIYAFIGAAYAYYIVQYPQSPAEYQLESIRGGDVTLRLLVAAALVLTASVGTGLWLSARKARKKGTTMWNETGKRMMINLVIPLLTGGLFIIILLYNGHYGVVAPACLIFYGLALINASPNLYEEVRYLGYFEIVLGLISAALPAYGLLFWTIGFGVFNVFYGALMLRKYGQ